MLPCLVMLHTFTHRIAHPLIFGCAPEDCKHPEQPIHAEWFSPFWWMRRMVRHFETVERIEQNGRH